MSYYKGTWNTSGSYKVTTQFSSAMTVTFTGNETALTMGIGNDQSIFDIYIDGSLWESFDGYAAASGDRVINIYLDKSGSHTIDIRNRAEKNKNSSGYTLRFKQLLVLSTVYDQQTINYGYDALARLLTATYAGVSPSRSYGYTYNRSGNRTQQVVTVGGTPTTTNYTYNAANQLTSGSATYDANGNLTSDGTNSYTWDRANRLLSMGGASYKYDGLNNRVQQTVGVNVTKYLLDLQPGLSVVLAETTGANVIRFVHSPRGIHAHKDAAGAWEWIMQDGLGSVRGVVDNTVSALESRNYDPYGTGFGATGSSQTSYGFTGEPMDTNGLLHLRARYYNPVSGVFTALDSFEGIANRPMSLNGYSWVEGNVPNAIDPTGMQQCDSLQDLFSPNAAGGHYARQYACQQLQNKLSGTVYGPISWDEVFNCYDCAMTAPIRSVESYTQGLMQAMSDGMFGAGQRRIDTAIEQYAISNPVVSPPPDTSEYGDDGYMEGISFAIGLIGGVQIGREIVYDFATFQRSTFAYTGTGWTFPTVGDSAYSGRIEGFVEDNPDTFEGGAFFSQYSGVFTVDSNGIALPGVFGVGLTHFWGQASGKYPAVTGNTYTISAGKTLPFDKGRWTLTYWPQGDRKSYVKRDCRVDIQQLRDDISNAYGSPIPGIASAIALQTARTIAVRTAEAKARDFDNKHGGSSCSCRPTG